MKQENLGRREFLLKGGAIASVAAAMAAAPKKGKKAQQATAPAAGAPAVVSSSGKQPPSIILLIGDDHDLQVGCYGHPDVKTPNLDKLASDGVRFTQGYCTTASCSASRSVLLTGLYNHANGHYGHAHAPSNFHFHPWVKPTSSIFKERGYATGVIAKLHVNPEAQCGFDFVGTANGKNGAAVAKDARAFLEGCAGKPFYLHVGYTDPHRAGKGFGNEQKYPGMKTTKYDPEKLTVPPFLPDKPATRADLADYYESVSRLDEGIGMMLDVLRETGRDRDTLVIYVGDNGMPWPGAKTTVYDPGIHLPLIVWSPNQKRRGLVNNAMVNWTDIAPTILDWTGTPQPDYGMQGRSFLQILEEENSSGWDEINFSHTFHGITVFYPMRGVRTRRYKYIHNLNSELLYPHASDLFDSQTWQSVFKDGDKMYGGRTVQNYLHRPDEELYDLEKDPNEFHNLAGDPKCADILKELREKTMAFRKRTKDPWLAYNKITAKGE